MDVREKLVELLKDAQVASVDKCHTYKACNSCPNNGQGILCRVPFSVDHLIDNGVTVQDNTEISDEILEQLRNAPVTILQEEPTIEVVQQWVSVKDRLPKNTGRYLTANISADDERCVFDLWFDCGEWYIDENDDEFIYKVTHWMPLPQLPKGE